MSGDVQPRRRRDKKKRKDDTEETSSHHPPRMPSIPSLETDDVNIHVHKESSTGGGICAKFVFFILLSALAVLIGLIITEYRGLTDLDTIEKESRFSQLFEGWIDTTPDDHDDHDDHHAIDHDDDDHDDDEHDDDHDEEEVSHEHDDDDDDEEDDHDEHDDDEEEEEEEAHDEDASEVQEDEEDEEDEVEETEEVAEPQESEAEDEEEEEEHSEQDVDEDDEQDEGSEQEQVYEDDEDDAIASKEDVVSKEDIASKEDAASKEEDVASKEEEDDDEVLEESKEQNDLDDDIEDGDDDDDTERKQVESKEVPDKDDDDDDNEEVDEIVNPEIDDNQEDEATNEEESIGVVKGAVGVAILVVAYVVLVKKWKSDKDAERKVEIPSDLSRRNTIIVPPPVQKVKQVIEQHADELTDEEIEEQKMIFHPKVKQQYQSFRHTYERSLTPESDLDARTSQKDEYVDDQDDEEDLEDGEEVEEEELVDEGEYEEGDYEEEEGVDEEVEEEELLHGDEEIVSEEEEEEEDEEEAEIEEELEPEDEEDEIDDEELMKKLEAKYGKLSGGGEEDLDDEDEHIDDDDQDYEYDVDDERGSNDDYDHHWKQLKPSGAQSVEDPEEHSREEYELENLTNRDDFLIVDQLDEALGNININAALALSQFNIILKTHPQSPRALYGKAQSLDNLAERKQSNNLLTEAITNYLELLKLPNVPDALLIEAANRCINRLHFLGQYGRAIYVHKLLIEKFPSDIKYKQQLTVTYLTINRIEDARNILKETLKTWPQDGFALVHYGFILKVNDGKMHEAIDYLHRGIATREKGVIDGRFYFHLGDALTRLGRTDEALEVYRDGVAQKVFLSQYQRSLYNVDRLKGRPWWRKEQMPVSYQQFFQRLEANYKRIRAEGIALMNKEGFFQDEAENLRDSGDWKQFELFARGKKHKNNCEKCPITCGIVESFEDAVKCRRGQIKFSIMHPGTHVWPHCGPTNCRIRVHLGLTVPPKTYIRVAEETRSWEEGKVMIFDDSFEHEVWHNGTAYRLVLIVDVWHPELTTVEKRTLSSI